MSKLRNALKLLDPKNGSQKQRDLSIILDYLDQSPTAVELIRALALSNGEEELDVAAFATDVVGGLIILSLEKSDKLPGSASATLASELAHAVVADAEVLKALAHNTFSEGSWHKDPRVCGTLRLLTGVSAVSPILARRLVENFNVSALEGYLGRRGSGGEGAGDRGQSRARKDPLNVDGICGQRALRDGFGANSVVELLTTNRRGKLDNPTEKTSLDVLNLHHNSPLKSFLDFVFTLLSHGDWMLSAALFSVSGGGGAAGSGSNLSRLHNALVGGLAKLSVGDPGFARLGLGLLREQFLDKSIKEWKQLGKDKMRFLTGDRVGKLAGMAENLYLLGEAAGSGRGGGDEVAFADEVVEVLGGHLRTRAFYKTDVEKGWLQQKVDQMWF